MKKTLIIIAIPVLFLISGKLSFAQEIYTGNAAAKSEVHNYVEGGNVETNIRIETNGEVKTLSATGSGTYDLKVNSSSENISPQVNQPTVPEISLVKKRITIKEEEKTFLNVLQNTWDDFFQRLMSVFNFNK